VDLIFPVTLTGYAKSSLLRDDLRIPSLVTITNSKTRPETEVRYLVKQKHDRKSVNGSQMHVKRKICDVRTWNKHLFLDISSTNTDTPVPSLYQCVETHNIEVFWLLSQPYMHVVGNQLLLSSVLERMCRPNCERLYAINSSAVNKKISLRISFTLSPFAHEKSHNRTLLFRSILLKHGRHFDYRNQSLNMCMRACYLDCHEAGLCCYLVIQIENLLLPLQLFYFHLWPIYWLSLVIGL
jgi:hypothetical protein